MPVETRVSGALRSLQRTRRALFVARAFGDAPARGEQNEQDGPDAATVVRSERLGYDGSLSRSGIDQLAFSRGSPATAARGVRRSRSSVSGGRSTTSEWRLPSLRLPERHRDGGRAEPDVRRARERQAGLSRRTTRACSATARSARRCPSRPRTRRLAGSFTWTSRENWTRNLAAAPSSAGVCWPRSSTGAIRRSRLVGLGLAYQGYFPGGRVAGVTRQHGLGTPVSLESSGRAGFAVAPPQLDSRPVLGFAIDRRGRPPQTDHVDAGATPRGPSRLAPPGRRCVACTTQPFSFGWRRREARCRSMVPPSGWTRSRARASSCGSRSRVKRGCAAIFGMCSGRLPVEPGVTTFRRDGALGEERPDPGHVSGFARRVRVAAEEGRARRQGRAHHRKRRAVVARDQEEDPHARRPAGGRSRPSSTSIRSPGSLI